MFLPLEIQNKIIMYSRPTYPYLTELNKYNMMVEYVLYAFTKKPNIEEILLFL